MYDCHNNSDSKNTIYGMEYIILYTKGLLITYTHTYIHTYIQYIIISVPRPSLCGRWAPRWDRPCCGLSAFL